MRQVVGSAALAKGRQIFAAVLHIGKAKLGYETAGAQHPQGILLIALVGIANSTQYFIL